MDTLDPIREAEIESTPIGWMSLTEILDVVLVRLRETNGLDFCTNGQIEAVIYELTNPGD